MRKKYNFLLTISSIDILYIYRLLRGRTVSEKMLKIPLFGPSSVMAFSSFSKWSPFNFIFILNRIYSGGNKSGY
jgi:hypothetical protein